MNKVKFTSLDIFEVSIPLRFTFAHSLATRSHAHNIIIAVQTDNATVGYAEVLPRKYLTGESISSVRSAIVDIWWPEIKKLEIPLEDNLSIMFDALYPLYTRADKERITASYAGIDIALFDAYARTCCIAGNRMFLNTGEHRAIPLVGVLSASNIHTVKYQSHIMHWLGYRRFKIKATNDEVADNERFSVVRSIVGNTSEVIADANAAWTVDTAISRIRKLKSKYDISFVEQPIAPGDTLAMYEVRKKSGVPIIADESLCTTDDAKKLLANKSVDCWSLRLAKNGGFLGANRLCNLAKEHKILCYSGALVGETSVMSAAGRAKLQLGDFIMQEYGFPRILLTDDPFRGGPGGFTGITEPLKDKGGLGVRLSQRILNKHLLNHLHLE